MRKFFVVTHDSAPGVPIYRASVSSEDDPLIGLAEVGWPARHGYKVEVICSDSMLSELTDMGRYWVFNGSVPCSWIFSTEGKSFVLTRISDQDGKCYALRSDSMSQEPSLSLSFYAGNDFAAKAMASALIAYHSEAAGDAPAPGVSPDSRYLVVLKSGCVEYRITTDASDRRLRKFIGRVVQAACSFEGGVSGWESDRQVVLSTDRDGRDVIEKKLPFTRKVGRYHYFINRSTGGILDVTEVGVREFLEAYMFWFCRGGVDFEYVSSAEPISAAEAGTAKRSDDSVMDLCFRLFVSLCAYRKAQRRMLDKWSEGDQRVQNDLWAGLHALGTGELDALIEEAAALFPSTPVDDTAPSPLDVGSERVVCRKLYARHYSELVFEIDLTGMSFEEVRQCVLWAVNRYDSSVDITMEIEGVVNFLIYAREWLNVRDGLIEEQVDIELFSGADGRKVKLLAVGSSENGDGEFGSFDVSGLWVNDMVMMRRRMAMTFPNCRIILDVDYSDRLAK